MKFLDITKCLDNHSIRWEEWNKGLAYRSLRVEKSGYLFQMTVNEEDGVCVFSAFFNRMLIFLHPSISTQDMLKGILKT